MSDATMLKHLSAVLKRAKTWDATSTSEDRAIERAIKRLKQFRAFASGFIEDQTCDCAERSWYGEGHDTACPISQAEYLLTGE